jgi:hypothetical protein
LIVHPREMANALAHGGGGHTCDCCIEVLQDSRGLVKRVLRGCDAQPFGDGQVERRVGDVQG